MEVAKKLTKKCDGLPLALTVLGGILSRKEPTYSAWHNMEPTMNWHNEEGKNCLQVLAMSYNDLPYHLKPCFLYFASYPEDYRISARHVTLMWIAEGFIIKDGGGTLEDKAKIYLEELVQRCLIKVIKKSWDGCCKHCSMHDLVRDLAIHEANEENFFVVFSKTKDGSQLDARVARRAALQSYTSTECGVHSTKTRSLLCFEPYTSKGMSSLDLDIRGFRLLRVVTIEGVNWGEEKVAYGKWLEGLIYLRYLGFRHCKTMPPGFGRVSFKSLRNLETLQLEESWLSLDDEPDRSLWEIQTLRHVITSKFGFTRNISNLDHLKNLQTLKWVALQKFPELGCNFNMRTIGLYLGEDFLKQYELVEQAEDMLKGLLKPMELLASLGVGCSHDLPIPIGSKSDLYSIF